MSGIAGRSISQQMLILLFIFSAVASLSCNHSLKKETGRSAICILHPDGDSGVKGIVTMYQASPLQPVYYEFTVGGLNPSSFHGVHIHEFGDISDGCKSAGSHYNPDGKKHGGPKDTQRHVGDLGNLQTDAKGTSEMHLADQMTTLYGQRSIIGRSMVVHKSKDDLGRGGDEQSAKTGNSGPRVACGVIGLTNEFKHFKWNHDLNAPEKQ